MPSPRSTQPPVIVWFRRDLRIEENPALAEAASGGRPVVPLFILDDETPADWTPGGASRWWLHGSLKALAAELNETGSRLILRRGRVAEILDAVIKETGAEGVYWNRRYDPFGIDCDRKIKADLNDRGLDCRSFAASLMFEPWEIKTKAGGWVKVYTRFWQACREKGDPPAPADAPKALAAPDDWPPSDDLQDWKLTPSNPDWATGFSEYWTPGAAGARERLEDFLEGPVNEYADARDFPARPATSGLSPHLAWGDIGPRQIWRAIKAAGGLNSKGRETFAKELVWRDFAAHVLYHFPHLPEAPMQEKFKEFPWGEDVEALRAWQRGQTGYPIVDAGMRELLATGVMHNRVRMVVASFLVKHLMQPWQEGERWFWDTLVDADLASNAFNWQWVAGCGADAAPYFRIFNPILQGEKFDPKGEYIRRWVPEIKDLPDKYLNQPWAAPNDVLADAGVFLGGTYPAPLVNHKAARERALKAFKEL